MPQTFVLPRQTALDDDANPMAGALAYFYRTLTTTPQSIYLDAALSVEAPNPLPADAAGRFPKVYLDPSAAANYRVRITDASGVQLYQEDDIDRFTISATEAGEALYPQTAAELAAGVTPVSYAYPAYNLLRYGGNGNSIAANDTPFSNWQLACDQATACGVIPEGDFKITADITLPGKVECSGRITGAFNTIYSARNGELGHRISGALRCAQLWFRGCYSVQVENVSAGTVVVDGLDGVHGTFWCRFNNIVTESLTLSITNFSVNQNYFSGLCRYVHITGNAGTHPTTQAHGNLFDLIDASNNGLVNYGFLQDDAKLERNFIRGLYYENGSNVVGNFDIIGWQGDSNGTPAVSRFCHLLGSVGLNQQTSKDFLSIGIKNAVRGGNWDWTDTDGKPPGFAVQSGSGTAVAVDTTEPGGIGLRYGSAFSGAFSGFSIEIQPTGCDLFGLVFFYKSADDFFAIESSGGIAHAVTPVVVDAVNNWKMARLSASCSKTVATTVTLYAYGAVGGTAKNMSLGGAFACGERIVSPPQKNHESRSVVHIPTLVNVANLDASTTGSLFYTREGNTVRATGRFSIDPTAGATLCRLRIPLAIAPITPFAAVGDLAGTVSAEDLTECGGIRADVANQAAEMRILATTTADHVVIVDFAYRMS